MPTKGDFSNYSLAPMDFLDWSMNNVVNMNQPNIGIWLLATIFIGATALKKSSNIDKSAYLLGTFFVYYERTYYHGHGCIIPQLNLSNFLGDFSHLRFYFYHILQVPK